MEVDTTSGPSNPLATLPFALSAARASALASHEERHITCLVSGTVNLQLQKLQLKSAHFADFEKLLSAERRDLQRRRQQLFMDRLNFQRRVRALEDATRKVSLAGGADDALEKLAEAIRLFGVGKGEEGMGVKSGEEEGGVEPVKEGGEGYARLEI
jgi:SWI/SNF related-matrix-associated actin-dependent regulator of chromatin subfamily C